MFIFFLIVLLLIPLTLIGFGALWKKSPPKTINWAYGYRTTWSMKSQDTWDFAHKYVGKLWIYTGIALTLVSISALIAFRNSDIEELGRVVLIVDMIQLLGLFLPIIPTEMALKNRFHKDGTKKSI
jgi:uncharacterized membrane protein